MHYFQPLPGQDLPMTAPNRLCHSAPSRRTNGALVLIQSSYGNDVNHSNFIDGSAKEMLPGAQQRRRRRVSDLRDH